MGQPKCIDYFLSPCGGKPKNFLALLAFFMDQIGAVQSHATTRIIANNPMNIIGYTKSI
jgi:hypothetical protein